MSLKNHFSWNLVGSIAPLLIGVFSIPFLIDKLGLELFGILTLLWALIGYFSLFDLGLGRALTQTISKYHKEKDKCDKYTSVGIILIFYVGVIAAIIVAIVSIITPMQALGISKNNLDDVKLSLLVASIGIPMTTLTSGFRGVLEGFFEFKKSNILKIYLGIGNFLFPVLAVILFDVNLLNVTISLVLARSIVLLLSLKTTLLFSKIAFYSLKREREVVKNLMSFGSWMTLSNIISPLMVTSDRFFLASLVGANVIAYYTVPFEIVIRALIIPAALTTAFFPYISKQLEINKGYAFLDYKKKLKILIGMMAFISVMLILCSKVFLELWIDKEFAINSWLVMCILSVGILFNGIAQLPHALIHANGDTKSVAVVHLIELILYIPTLIFMIYCFGIIGAAISWSTRSLIDLILMLHLSKRVFRVSGCV